MQQRSVADLADNEFGMGDLVKRVPHLTAAAQLIDAAIAEQIQTPPVDGLYREVCVVTLLERANAQGVNESDVQFVLNVLPKGVYSFGGRLNGELLDSAQVVGMLRAIAFAQRDGTPIPPDAAEATAVHRFSASSFQPQS